MADETATEWDPNDYDDDAGFVAAYGESVLDLLDPQPGERVLDLGCGTGHLTAGLAERVGPDGRVVGVDSAPDMVHQARETYPELDFVRADAREFDPAALAVESDSSADAGAGAFDAVFSNAVLH